jgi:hypothetical protein
LILAVKYISQHAQLRLPSASLSSLDLLFSTCISKLTRFWSPSAFLISLNHSLQVRHQTRSITASKYILEEWWQVCRDTGVMEEDRVIGSIYSADRGVYRYHLISICSYHTIKIHTESFPTLCLSRTVQDFLNPCNGVDPQRWVVA